MFLVHLLMSEITHLRDVRVNVSTEQRVILGLIMSGDTNSFHIHQNGCSLQGVHGATSPAPPFSL